MPTEPRTVWVVCPNACDGQRDERDLPCTECDGSGGYDAIAIPIAGGSVVVEKEAWTAAREKVARAIRDAEAAAEPDDPPRKWDDLMGVHVAVYLDMADKAIEAALGGLFPAGIVVAEAMGTVCLGETRSGPTVILDEGEDSQLIGGRQVAVLLEKRSHD